MKAPGLVTEENLCLKTCDITGGQVISEELGIKLENVGIQDLGSCKKVRIDKEVLS